MNENIILVSYLCYTNSTMQLSRLTNQTDYNSARGSPNIRPGRPTVIRWSPRLFHHLHWLQVGSHGYQWTIQET